MNLFATDIDGTIITPKIGERKDVILVSETPRGKSWISQSGMIKLLAIRKIACFVPVTTRGIVSYSTIDFGFPISYALVDNGAILLQDGKVNQSWLEESRRMAAEERDVQRKGFDFLKSKGLQTKTDSEFVIDFMDVAKKEKEEMVDIIQEFSDIVSPYFDICSGSSYVYATSKCLSKGKSLKRLSEILKPHTIVSAGDGEQDYSMFKIADFSIGKYGSPALICYKSENNSVLDFCDYVLTTAEKIFVLMQEDVLPDRLKTAQFIDKIQEGRNKICV